MTASADINKREMIDLIRGFLLEIVPLVLQISMLSRSNVTRSPPALALPQEEADHHLGQAILDLFWLLDALYRSYRHGQDNRETARATAMTTLAEVRGSIQLLRNGGGTRDVEAQMWRGMHQIRMMVDQEHSHPRRSYPGCEQRDELYDADNEYEDDNGVQHGQDGGGGDDDDEEEDGGHRTKRIKLAE